MLFISPKKLFSFLRYLNFCFGFFAHVGKRLDNKAKVNFKTYEVTNWATNNILKSTDNQAMKFGQVIESNMTNNFLEESYENVVDKIVPNTFLKNKNS